MPLYEIQVYKSPADSVKFLAKADSAKEAYQLAQEQAIIIFGAGAVTSVRVKEVETE